MEKALFHEDSNQPPLSEGTPGGAIPSLAREGNEGIWVIGGIREYGK